MDMTAPIVVPFFVTVMKAKRTASGQVTMAVTMGIVHILRLEVLMASHVPEFVKIRARGLEQ